MDMFQVTTLGLLGIIAVSLVFVAVSMRRKHLSQIFGLSIDNQIGRLNQAAAHHIEVNAILALTEQFRGDPNLSNNLAGYTRQVVDAALTHRVNSLGNDLKRVDRELSIARGSLAANPVQTTYGHDYMKDVKALEALRTDLQSQLDEASSLIQGRATVSWVRPDNPSKYRASERNHEERSWTLFGLFSICKHKLYD